jgi:hypothetical protein
MVLLSSLQDIHIGKRGEEREYVEGRLVRTASTCPYAEHGLPRFSATQPLPVGGHSRTGLSVHPRVAARSRHISERASEGGMAGRWGRVWTSKNGLRT